MREEELSKLVSGSGFLFQLAVEDHVRKNTSQHNWLVSPREYPWATTDGGHSGFMDFVAEQENLRCVFECKRTRGGEWIFLVPEGLSETIDLRMLWSVVGQSGRTSWDWSDRGFHPRTLVSEFCIVRGASDDDKPMLERIAGNLVRASESLAREELSMMNRGYTSGLFGYVPVIVTNAKLYACRYESAAVDLTTGDLPSGSRFEEVGAIRFRKALPTERAHPPGTYDSITKGLIAKERSAFVVHVAHLSDWLKSLALAPSSHLELSRPWLDVQ